MVLARCLKEFARGPPALLNTTYVNSERMILSACLPSSAQQEKIRGRSRTIDPIWSIRGLPVTLPGMGSRWTAAEERLLLKYGNAEVARRTGRTVAAVQGHKQKLRRLGRVLPYLRKVRWAEWTPAKDKIIAENPPRVAMELLDLSPTTIRLRRKALGLGPWIRPRKPKKPTGPPRPHWTAEEDRLVQTLAPREAAKAIGRRTLMAVHLRRMTLKRQGKQLKWNPHNAGGRSSRQANELT